MLGEKTIIIIMGSSCFGAILTIGEIRTLKFMEIRDKGPRPMRKAAAEGEGGGSPRDTTSICSCVNLPLFECPATASSDGNGGSSSRRSVVSVRSNLL